MTAQLNPRGDVAVLVPAAGAGLRLGPGGPKALRLLGGEPLLAHAVRRVAAAPSVRMIVVAAPAAEVEAVRELLAPIAEVTVVPGGAERQESVARALAVVPPDVEIVLVHDAARALTPPQLIESVAAAVRGGLPAVIPVLPVVDTIKQVGPGGVEPGGVEPGGVEPGGVEPGGVEPGGVEPGGAEPGGAEPGGAEPGGAEPGGGVDPREAGLVGPREATPGGIGPGAVGLGGVVPGEVVHGTVDRSVLRSVQTPQGFRHDVLAAAHAAASDPLTDDAGLVEKAGVAVTCVPGSELALKITRPLDLILAEALLNLPDPPA